MTKNLTKFFRNLYFFKQIWIVGRKISICDGAIFNERFVKAWKATVPSRSTSESSLFIIYGIAGFKILSFSLWTAIFATHCSSITWISWVLINQFAILSFKRKIQWIFQRYYKSAIIKIIIIMKGSTVQYKMFTKFADSWSPLVEM